MRALGALCWYLSDCRLDQELLSRRSFQLYTPPDEQQHQQQQQQQQQLGRRMILDGVTLRNLDVLVNSSLGRTAHGTLLERLNRTATAFGQVGFFFPTNSVGHDPQYPPTAFGVTTLRFLSDSRKKRRVRR